MNAHDAVEDAAARGRLRRHLLLHGVAASASHDPDSYPCANGHIGPFVRGPVEYLPGSERDATGEGWIGAPTLVCASCRSNVSEATAVQAVTVPRGNTGRPMRVRPTLLRPAVCCPRCHARPALRVTKEMADLVAAHVPPAVRVGTHQCALRGCSAIYDLIAADFASAGDDARRPRVARDVTAEVLRG